tara:strand:+ start:2045 stop:2758 length:714 start_codon:yes stop_codon:yes gene_type:complete
MILLVDADSLIFASCLKQKETELDTGFVDCIDEAKEKFDDKLSAIVNHLEGVCDVEEVRIFNGSIGNFRKLITTKYKANRKKQVLPPLLNDLHNLIKFDYDSVFEYGVETDDVVAKHWYNETQKVGRDNVMIVSIDKDYKQFPALIYNYHYKHQEILDINVQQAMYNFYEQMIVGDTADNVNYFKGKGKKFAEKYFENCETEYQYTRKMYQLFKQEYKGKARHKYVECYHLLKLRTI